MKILHIINSLHTGGAEKLIVDNIVFHQKNGKHMDVLSLSNTKTPFWKELEKELTGEIFGLSSGSVYNPFLVFKIIPFLRKYDILHVHLFPSLYLVALAKVLSFSKIKFVYTEHNTNNKRRDFLVFKFIDRFIYRMYDKLITIAEEVDFNLKKHLQFNVSKFVLIKNGVNLDMFYQAIPYPKSFFFNLNDKLLIQVSSFTSQKDQSTLIKSLLFLSDNTKLLLVGEGMNRKKCEELVVELKLSDRVLFLGVRTDVPRLLKTCDIIVLSSFFEGLSLSSIEGLASGNPFIASDVPGLKQVVKGAGLLFPQGDVKILSTQINKLLNDPIHYSEISRLCLDRSKQYDISIMAQHHMELYNSLIK